MAICGVVRVTPWRSVAMLAVLGVSLAGLAMTANPLWATGSATSGNCTITSSATVSTPLTYEFTGNAQLDGAVAGTTVTATCSGLDPTAVYAAVEASPLAGVTRPATTATLANEIDPRTLGLVTADANGDLTATVTIPATFTATDPAAVCPPSQAQANAGLTNCVVTVANIATSVPAAVVDVNYATGQLLPARPKLVVQHDQHVGDTIRTPNATGFWGGVFGFGGPVRVVFLTPQGRVPASASIYFSQPVWDCADTGCSTANPGALTPPESFGSYIVPSAAAGARRVCVLQPNTTVVPGNGPNNTVKGCHRVSVT